MDAKSIAQQELADAEKLVQDFVTDYESVMQRQRDSNRFGVPGVTGYSSYLFRAVAFSRHLGEESAQTRMRIHTEIPMLQEIVAVELQDRESSFERGSKYDKGAQADLYMIESMLLFIAVSPLEEVKTLLQETDYGAYRGHPKVNNIAGVFMRALRAYLRGDEAALCVELDSVQEAKIDQLIPFFLRMPRKHWQALLPSLFVGSGRDFEKAFKAACKWYDDARTRQIKKDYSPENIYLPQADETRMAHLWKLQEQSKHKYMIETSINPVFLVAIKLAKVCRKYEFEWDDRYCPKDLIALE